MFYNFVRTPAIVKTGMGILGKIDELLHTSHLHFSAILFSKMATNSMNPRRCAIISVRKKDISQM